MKNTLRTIVLALVCAVLFLALYLLLDWGILISGALCVGLYVGLELLLRPRRVIAGIDVEDMKGAEEIEKLLKDAGDDMRQIEKALRVIERPSVRAEAQRLYTTGNNILKYLKEHPEKISMARRFFTYYLDTAASLLKRYMDFQRTGLKSHEVGDILDKTEKALPVLEEAFEKQFTKLVMGELMDVEADIELLKSTLEMEGGK